MKNLSKSLQNAILKKGFIVYKYISLGELLQTIKRDYLEVLSKFNTGIALICGILGVIQIYFFILFIFSFYLILFIYLLIKLFIRTKKYFYINNVIFTEKNILIGNHIFGYDDSQKKTELLSLYEKEFDEYLANPSNLKKVIKSKEKELFVQVKKLFFKFFENFDGKNSVKLPILISLVIYSVSLFIFYYLGLVLGGLFFGIFALILKTYLFFKQSIELKMKISIESMENNICKLNLIEKKLEKKLNDFKGGEISNIEDFINKKFTMFYSLIGDIISEKNRLKNVIENSKHNNIINFKKFNLYIKNEYNKPIKNMIHVLKTYLKKIKTQKNSIEELDISVKESGNIKIKKLQFEKMIVNINEIISKIKSMQL